MEDVLSKILVEVSNFAFLFKPPAADKLPTLVLTAECKEMVKCKFDEAQASDAVAKYAGASANQSRRQTIS